MRRAAIRLMIVLVAWLFTLLLLGWLAPVQADDDLPPPLDRRIDFEREVRPILTARCLACHGPDQQKSGLRLDRRSSAMKGGDGGEVIIAGKGEESPIVELTAGLEPGQVMPPKGERLTTEQVAILRTWIDQGADWPGVEDEDPRDWWSLRPPVRSTVPAIEPSETTGVTTPRNPIDAFVLAKLREQKLSPSPEADRRTLIRRLSFDLLGLPPTLAEIEAFERDARPDAYERLVDRLLASPRYGERWARHWLDVVHYGDTHGYDKDKPRPNAWPYRDYVIRAFNTDKPYGRFVAEQVAGDVLFPDTLDGIVALGFIAAGPWDFIGHAEIEETKIDGKIARHLDRDDMVANTINTFVGLTVQCAQCHNHKFDPIAQEDYYRLQAVFAALDRADKSFYPDPAVTRRSHELALRHETLDARRQALLAAIAEAGGPELAALDQEITNASRPDGEAPEYGYHSGLANSPDDAKWVQVDLGRSVAIDRVALWGCRDAFNDIGDGFGFPVRFKVEISDDPAFSLLATTIADRTQADLTNPGVAVQTLAANETRGRYVRVTATRLAARQNDYNFALAELQVFDAAGVNLASGAKVSALDTIEARPRWSTANLVDGRAPGMQGGEDLDQLRRQREAIVARSTDEATRRELAQVESDLAVVKRSQAELPEPSVVYAGTIHHGKGGPFRGTGASGGKPRVIHLLNRGDVNRPGKVVSPAALNVFKELPGTFDLSDDQPESDRRAALARWLTNEKNPLTWRSIVNRVWQYHFGRGIVATPNDFGKMGQPPSHPELLDWLALEFRDGGQSIKALHRLIVTSATYRQSSAGNLAAEAIDSGNTYLWRMSRRKLEAEAVRDSALVAAGKLEPAMYGPAFQDFVVDRPEHSPHYQYELQDPDDPRIFRRSIYRFLVRSKPQPFMTVLDCADPSMQVEKRNETGSPLQALALYNNGFMLTMARHLASRAESAGDLPAQVAAAFRLAIGRAPTADELDALRAYAAEYGLAGACRVILNLNEFMFVD